MKSIGCGSTGGTVGISVGAVAAALIATHTPECFAGRYFFNFPPRDFNILTCLIARLRGFILIFVCSGSGLNFKVGLLLDIYQWTCAFNFFVIKGCRRII